MFEKEQEEIANEDVAIADKYDMLGVEDTEDKMRIMKWVLMMI